MNQVAASTLILAKIQLVKLVLDEARIECVLRKQCLDVLKTVVTPVAAPIVAQPTLARIHAMLIRAAIGKTKIKFAFLLSAALFRGNIQLYQERITVKAQSNSSQRMIRELSLPSLCAVS